MEADVELNTKTRKRTEDASGADRVENEDNSSTERVNGGPTSLTSFGMIAEPPDPEKSIGNALIDKGAEAPKPCLPPVEMRTPTATGGLLPAGTAPTAMRVIFPRPLFFWSLGEEIKEKTGRTTLTSLPLLLGGKF